MDSKDLASLLVEYGWELLEGCDDSEKDDFLIDSFQEALCGLLVSYKIMNPTVNEMTLIESVMEAIEQSFNDKFMTMEIMKDKYLN